MRNASKRWHVAIPLLRNCSASLYPLIVGALIGGLAWGWDHSPLIAIWFIPLAYLFRSRWAVFAYALGYHGAAARFLPEFAGNWFDSIYAGLELWAGITLISSAFWARAWTNSERPWKVFTVATLAMIGSVLTPVALVLCGSPLPAWGYALQGARWLGVAGAVLGTGLLSVAVRNGQALLKGRFTSDQVHGVVAGLLVVTVGVCVLQIRNDGRALDHAVGVKTHWGAQPKSDDEVIARIEKIGKLTRGMAGGANEARLLVFPETILGRYDSSFISVMEREVVRSAQRAGQFVVIGFDQLNQDGRTLSNKVMLIRPNRTFQIASQRQPSPVSMWRPWSETGHYPADWMAGNLVELVPGYSARVMFCYEEYLPVLHLINEAKDEHQLIISVANLWAASGAAASSTQAAHTEGMALMFGHPFLRSENRSQFLASNGE